MLSLKLHLGLISSFFYFLSLSPIFFILCATAILLIHVFPILVKLIYASIPAGNLYMKFEC